MHARNTVQRMAAALVAGAGVACFAMSVEGGIILGSAQGFAALGGSGITNTGFSVITGDLGVWPNNTATGFPPGIVNGQMHLGTAPAMSAQADAFTAYTTFAGMTPTQNLTGMDLGSLTLTPGVYSFLSSAFLTGTLTLDAQGDPNAEFIFQTGSTLITASASSVLMINGAEGSNVWWQVGSSATLGTNTSFTGSILALSSITMTTGASIVDGRAFALNGALTMDSNIISIPTPGALALLAVAGVGMRTTRRRSE